MKKIVTFIFLVAFSYNVKAQEVGVRLGDVVGNTAAVDLVFGTGQFHRLHADVSFGTGVGAELLWDMLYRPLKKEEFHWYVGVGPSFLFDDPFFFGIAGEGGIEYHFNSVPIALGVDWRPTLNIVEDTEFVAERFGFNARWVFGK